MTNRSQIIEAEEKRRTVNGIERRKVVDQLERILASSYFSASRRFPMFLTYIVERELDGFGGELKERTIGIDVFGRDLTYDTSVDPIVRVTAGEVRKRLDHYYASPERAAELRISLTPGSYVPHFTKPKPEVEAARPPAVAEKTHAEVSIPVVVPPLPATTAEQSQRHVPRHIFVSIAAALLVVLCAAAWWRHALLAGSVVTSSEVVRFWQPFSQTPEPTVIAMGTVANMHPPTPSEPTPEMPLLDAVHHYNIVPLPSAIALSRITSKLGEDHVKPRVLNADIASFDDVQAGPTILIGAFGNQWTMRLTTGLRFTFEDSPTISRILDKEAKIQPDWTIHRTANYSDLVQDYAIIARYHDRVTGKLVVIAAGIGPNGTLAAGEFLTTEESLKKLNAMAPKNWSHEDFEAVIRTQVIDGKSGPPQVIAASFW